MKKKRGRRATNKKSLPHQYPITVKIQTSGDDYVSYGCYTHKQLKLSIFEDTKGRKRLNVVDVPGEPLLSNYTAPVIEYDNGEKECYINGYYVDETFLPGGTGIITWSGEVELKSGLPKQKRALHLISPCCRLDGDTWKFSFLDFDNLKNEIIIHINMEDLDPNGFNFANHVDLPSSVFFRTQFFGKMLGGNLLYMFEGQRGFATEKGVESILKQLLSQLRDYDIIDKDVNMDEFKSFMKEHFCIEKKKNIEDLGPRSFEHKMPADKQKPKSSVGFGTAVVTGLATITAAGVIGALAGNKVQVPQKEVVNAR